MACIVLTDATDALLMLKVLLSCLLIRMHACFATAALRRILYIHVIHDSVRHIQLCQLRY